MRIYSRSKKYLKFYIIIQLFPTVFGNIIALFTYIFEEIGYVFVSPFIS